MSSSFNFGLPSLNFKPSVTFSSPIGRPRRTAPSTSKALQSSTKQLTNYGIGVATQLKGKDKTTLKKAAKAVGHQPFDLSGKRKVPPPLEPKEKFKGKAKQLSNQPFVKAPPPPTAQEKFVKKAQQIAHQPFKLVVTPPKIAPSDIFAMRANQIAHQPFKIGGKPKAKPKMSFKLKAKSIGQLAAHPLFKHTLKEERQAKTGRFKSLTRAIIRTARLFRTTEAIKIAAKMENDLIGSNADEIKSGNYPMLKREVLSQLFEYLPVPDLKTARLVCEFWKRFATVSLQQKSHVKLSGVCSLCKSEWMSSDESIEAHDHAETISFYRFVLFIQDIPEEYRYFMPFRSFKIKKINLYFIRGINTAPTRIFLMFLKLWGERIHELHLKEVQLTPPDAFYRIVDCCKRVQHIIFDDTRVWLDPLADANAEAKFSMHINYYLKSITFITNWIGEELLHWQMILQAFPCLQELNLIDVAKTEINHCLIALLNLPEKEEEELALRSVGGFKKLSRKIMTLPFNLQNAQESSKPLPSFKTITNLLIDMPFITNRRLKLETLEQKQPKKFKKFTQKLQSQPFPLSFRDKIVPAVTPGRLKVAGKKIMHQPFNLAPKPKPEPEPEEEEEEEEPMPNIALGIQLKLAAKAGRTPFGKLKALKIPPDQLGKVEEPLPDIPLGIQLKLANKLGRTPFGRLKKGDQEVEELMPNIPLGIQLKMANKLGRTPFGRLKKGGQEVQDPMPNIPLGIQLKMANKLGRTPFGRLKKGDQEVEELMPNIPLGIQLKMANKLGRTPFGKLKYGSGSEEPQPKKREKIKFRSSARSIINMPFTLINPTQDLAPEVFAPKKKSFKAEINKILHQPFQVKPKIKPLDRFRMAVTKIINQPFNLGEPTPHEKVLPGSILRRINVSSRRNYEDQLQVDMDQRKRLMEIEETEDAEDDEENEFDYEDSSSEKFKGDVEVLDEEDDNESESDNQSTIQDSDFTEMETNELVAEVVHRFKIKYLTLRVNYTEDDAGTFPVVLEACREHVVSINLTRHAKVYFSELDLKFLNSPFETPEETIMDFPNVTSLSIAHNIVGHINEIRSSFPSLQNLTINVVTTEFLCVKNKPYKTYVRTNLVLSMKYGYPMPTVRNFTWNIQESRHPFTQKRTLVYKCNAITYVPRIFPNLSKLTISITTSHELHVIFRYCVQLHDLVVLKNSFYRTKDDDIIGQDEDEEERLEILEELDPGDIGPTTEKVRTLHPNVVFNQGIKQLKFLRRLSLENNNCCLTNLSVEHGFIHLRRLRSIHISRCKRIELRALRQLKKCRFLVRVSITKEKVKSCIPVPLEGPDDENESPIHLPALSTQMQKVTGCPNVYIFQSPLTDSKYLAKPQGGFSAYTKYDKIGGKRFDFVTTTYEVNGRQYKLIRRHYEGQEYNREIWERKFRLAELHQREEDAKNEVEELERSAEIDPKEMIRKAEEKRLKEVEDEESDCERFMNEYDDDYEEDEEGYCDEDDDLLIEEKQRVADEEEESSDEDGICLEADTMYEGDNYDDTDPKSSDDAESYCDSATEAEYQADKETCDETGKETAKEEEKAVNVGETSQPKSPAGETMNDKPQTGEWPAEPVAVEKSVKKAASIFKKSKKEDMTPVELSDPDEAQDQLNDSPVKEWPTEPEIEGKSVKKAASIFKKSKKEEITTVEESDPNKAEDQPKDIPATEWPGGPDTTEKSVKKAASVFKKSKKEDMTPAELSDPDEAQDQLNDITAKEWPTEPTSGGKSVKKAASIFKKSKKEVITQVEVSDPDEAQDQLNDITAKGWPTEPTPEGKSVKKAASIFKKSKKEEITPVEVSDPDEAQDLPTDIPAKEWPAGPETSEKSVKKAASIFKKSKKEEITTVELSDPNKVQDQLKDIPAKEWPAGPETAEKSVKKAASIFKKPKKDVTQSPVKVPYTNKDPDFPKDIPSKASSTITEVTSSYDAKSCIATVGSSCEKDIIERTSLELLKNLKEVAQKQLRAKEKAKRKESTDDGVKVEKKKKPREKSERKGKSKKSLEKESNIVSHPKLEPAMMEEASKKVLSWKTDETRDIEYMESLRHVSLSRHGPCHMSPVPVPNSFPFQHYDPYHDSPPASDAAPLTSGTGTSSSSANKPSKKDKKSKSKRHSKDESHERKKFRKHFLDSDNIVGHKKKSKEDKKKRDKSRSQEKGGKVSRIGGEYRIGSESRMERESRLGRDSRIGSESRMGRESRLESESRIGRDSRLGIESRMGRDSAMGRESRVGSRLGRESSIGMATTLKTDSPEPVELVGDLRHQLIKNMLSNVKKEKKK